MLISGLLSGNYVLDVLMYLTFLFKCFQIYRKNCHNHTWKIRTFSAYFNFKLLNNVLKGAYLIL